MKLLPSLATLVFAVAAAASGSALAAQYSSDQERRTQNREEALAKWQAQNGQAQNTSSRTTTEPATKRETMRERGRAGTQSVRNFTHRQAEKARRFGERQDRRHGTSPRVINTSPEGGGGK